MDGKFQPVAQILRKKQTTLRLSLSEDVTWSWKQIAVEKNILDDSILAAFLVTHYEETKDKLVQPSSCVICSASLSQFCSQCFNLTPRQEQADNSQTLHTTDQSWPTSENVPQKTASSSAAGVPFLHKLDHIPSDLVSSSKEISDETKDYVNEYDDDTDIQGTKQTDMHVKQNASENISETDYIPAEKSLAEDRYSETFTCDICKRTFKDPDLLVVHIQKHDKQMVHECNRCKAKFFEAKILDLHMNIHNQQKKYPCDQCNASYTRIDNLTKHKLKKHQSTSKVSKRRGKTKIFVSGTSDHNMNNIETNCVQQSLIDIISGSQDFDSQGEKVHEKSRMKFCCNQCGKGFQRKDHLQSHVLTHSGEKRYGCQQCGISFAHIRSLVAHMHSHNNHKPFQCGKCHKSFTVLINMAKHECKQTDAHRLQCESCGKKFITSSQLILHSRLHSTSSESFENTADTQTSLEEDKSLQGQKSLTQRTDVKSGAGRLKACAPKWKVVNTFDKEGEKLLNVAFESVLPSFNNDTSVQFAEKNVHSGTETHPQYCQVCGARFMFLSNLTRHQQDHTGDNAFSCSHCLLTFRSLARLQIHARSHSTRKDFACQYCGKVLKSGYTLKQHLYSHTGEKPFKCEECGACFTFRCTYKAHLRKHTGDRPYLCPHCGKSFLRSSNLTVHIRSHTGAGKDYPCQYCGKILKSVYTLKEHVRSHTGERPFKCDHCGARFTLSGTYKAHLRKHTGDRPYLCPHCGKSFIHSSNLSVHMRIHTGEKPYKCTQCPMAFAIANSLTEHMRKHTGDKPFKCSACGKGFAKSCNRLVHFRTHSKK